MGNAKSVNTIWNGAFLFLLVCNTLTATAFQIITPTLPKYISSGGATLAVAGTISSLYSIAALIGRPFSGMLSDRYSTKYLGIIGMLVTGLCTFGLGVSRSLPIMGICRIAQGLGFSLSSTGMIALATNYMPPERIGEGVGCFALGNLLAMSIGPNIGIQIGNTMGYQCVFLVAGLCTLIPGLALFFLREVSAEKPARQRLALKAFFLPELVPYLFFTAVFSFSTSLISSYLSMLSEEREIAYYGFYFTLNAAAMLLSRPLAGKLSDRKSGAFVILPAYCFCGLALLLIAGAKSCWPLFFAAIANAFGAGVGSPACQSECIKKAGVKRRGMAISMYYIGADAAYGIAPSVGGAISDIAGYAAMYRSGALLCGIAVLGYVIYIKAAAKN